MYIKTATITNVRSIANLTWQIQEDQAAGWHVILGDNGAGKSTFVRSIALALVGPRDAMAFRLNYSDWSRKDTMLGRIELKVIRDSELDTIKEPLQHANNKLILPPIEVEFTKIGGESGHTLTTLATGRPSKVLDGIWNNLHGWFSASYGPFRRFSGENKGYEHIIEANSKVARHLNAFDGSVGLTEGLRWLRELQFKHLEKMPEGYLLNRVKDFVNHDKFLPFGVCLKNVSSQGVEFMDANGCLVAAEELGDGYRSVLSMTFDLIRQLTTCYGSDRVFDTADPTKIIVPGVVMIDEVDAHLHPTWQRQIGVWFRKHFPNMQFIVTTHSPLVCQAATHGTVFKLPTPGTDEQGQMICGEELNRLRYGNILDAYSTGAFGKEVGRSEEGEQKLDRLAELNFRELDGTLNNEERREQEQLRAMMPTTSHIIKPNTAGGV